MANLHPMGVDANGHLIFDEGGVGDDGGPAFPMQPIPPTGPQATSTGIPFSMSGITDVWTPGAPGMSLRDYFAAQALKNLGEKFAENFTSDIVAQHAYTIADAMLEARKR